MACVIFRIVCDDRPHKEAFKEGAFPMDVISVDTNGLLSRLFHRQ